MPDGVVRRWHAAALAALVTVALSGSLALGQQVSPSPSPGGGSIAGDVSDGGGEVEGAAFLPARTVAYLEFRGDLPDGQDEALTQVLTRFPGFEDSAGFESTADVTLDAWLADATGGAFSWISDVRPWFGGRISVGLLDYLSVARDDSSVLVGLEVTDPARAAEFAGRVADLVTGDVPGALAEESYEGVTVTSWSDGAYAVGEDVLLVGSGVDEVRAGLDVLAGEAPALASVAGFETALRRVPEARLVAGWADLAALRPILTALVLTGMGPSRQSLTAFLDGLALDATFYLAARPDGVIAEVIITPGSGTPETATGEPHLASSYPAGTRLLYEVPAAGETIANAARWSAHLGFPDPGQADAVEVLALSVEKLTGWLGDTAFGAGTDGGRLWFGLVAEGASDGAADVYVGMVEAALAAAVLERSSDPWGPEAPFSVRTSDVDGVAVTTVTIDPEVRAFSLPIEPSIGIAQDGDRLIIGTPGFVASSLRLDPADSLASDGRYRQALAETGGPNAGHLYLDISGTLEAIEPMLVFNAPGYEEIAPWVQPFDRVTLGASVSEDGVATTTLLLQLR
jgi:hypothetical protein